MYLVDHGDDKRAVRGPAVHKAVQRVLPCVPEGICVEAEVLLGIEYRTDGGELEWELDRDLVLIITCLSVDYHWQSGEGKARLEHAPEGKVTSHSL